VNRRLLPMQSDHFVAGSTIHMRSDVRVTVEAYRRTHRHYPVSIDFPQLTLANHGIGFDMTNLLLPLTSAGAGRSHGAEVFIKKPLSSRTYGQVAYSLGRTEHAALDGVVRRGAFDTPHVLTLLGGWRPGSRWALSGRFSFASGRLYTPALLPESEQQNRWIHDLSRVHGSRLPPVHRLDLRLDRRVRWAGADFALFFEAQNVYNRRAVLEFEWNEKTRAPHAVRQLGTLPILGLNVKF
jgi:hypothetical protein